MSDQPPETIAVVGRATLIKRPDGKYELLDCGSEADRDEIMAWVVFHLKGAQVVITGDRAPQTGRFAGRNAPS